MIAGPQYRGLSCVLLVLVGIAVFTVAICASLPHDIPFGVFWSRYLAVDNQHAPFAAGTLLYVFGIISCIAAVSFFRRRGILLRSALGVGGLLCAGAGILYVCLVLISNADKVR